MTISSTEIPEHLRVDFDVYDESLAGVVDTFSEKLEAVRAVGPVTYSPLYGGHWIVTGYREAHEVLRDAELYSSYPTNLVNAGDGKLIPAELDAPEHPAFRQALQPLFSPTRMRALEPEIRATVNTLIDAFAARGQCEFVEAFAHELPARVFLSLMGWPLQDAPMFTEATDAVVFGKPGATEEESGLARQQAAQNLFGYFLTVVADRRTRAVDDITTTIINTPIKIEGQEPRQLTDDELARMFFLLLVGGMHTTQGTLAWSMLHLARNPEQRQRLIDDPELIPAAVEEMLRIEAAVSTCRRATRDTVLAGVPVRKDDVVLVILQGANRDPGEFADPADVRIDRTPNRHLSFGAGPHRCVGSHLARIVIRTALDEIHRRIPDYRLDPDNPPLWHASQVRGALRLPLLFGSVNN